jgi:hypothetical protein
MSYTAYTEAEMIQYAKDIATAKYLPEMLKTVTGIPDSPVADLVFGQVKIVSKAKAWFDREQIETINLTKFSTELGKYEPVGQIALSQAKFEPQMLKLTRTETASTIENKFSPYGYGMSTQQAITETVSTFLKHKQKLYINQGNQFMQDGVITYPLYDDAGVVINAGDSIDYKTYYLSGNSGAIYDYDTTDSIVDAWDAASQTGQVIHGSLKRILKQGQTNTNKKHFMKIENILIFASDTAFAALPAMVNSSVDPEKSFVRPDNDSLDYFIGFGKSAFRIINDPLPFYTWAKSAGSGDWTATSENAVAADHILFLDNTKGNFKTIDLHFPDFVKSAPPYTIVTEFAQANELLKIYYRSKTLLWGDPSAMMTIDVLEP